MTTAQILKYVNYICVKENSGGTLTPDQYNIILLASNIDLFNKLVGQAELLSIQSKIPFSEALFSMAHLREFHVLESITFTAGSFALSGLANTFAYWGSLVSLYRGAYRRIELLTDKELADRRTNMVTKQLKDFPGAQVLGDTIKVYPTDIATAEFTYMKVPTTPVYDYYIDANANQVYLTQGQSHTLITGEIGSAGQGSGQTVTSLTVELQWNNLYHVEFCNEVLRKVGINLKDVQLQQYIREVDGKQS